MVSLRLSLTHSIGDKFTGEAVRNEEEFVEDKGEELLEEEEI